MASNKDVYVLPRQWLESCRLTAQHSLVTERQGWLLHPKISKHINDKEDVTIADLATGNGVWLLQMSEKYPNAKLIGLDISDSQLPPAYAWPENVTFDIYNMFDPVPEQYLGRFDVLHIRLLIAVIHTTDKDALIDRFKSMLKPGGYIQWAEVVNTCWLTVDESLQAKQTPIRCYEVLENMTPVFEVAEWSGKLHEVLDKHGFEEVIAQRPPFKKIMLQAETVMCEWVMTNLLEFLLASRGDEVKETCERALKVMHDDLDQGVKWVYDWYVVIGRRPL